MPPQFSMYVTKSNTSELTQPKARFAREAAEDPDVRNNTLQNYCHRYNPVVTFKVEENNSEKKC